MSSRLETLCVQCKRGHTWWKLCSPTMSFVGITTQGSSEENISISMFSVMASTAAFLSSSFILSAVTYIPWSSVPSPWSYFAGIVRIIFYFTSSASVSLLPTLVHLISSWSRAARPSLLFPSSTLLSLFFAFQSCALITSSWARSQSTALIGSDLCRPTVIGRATMSDTLIGWDV